MGTDADTLAALAEPNRLRIVELLEKAPRSVGEIAALLVPGGQLRIVMEECTAAAM